ncbi:hypothetical protein GGI07_003122 [Coemansia sp. Benny D115]|nr:hypothetical protein GGI07_003122 [Coemansia sp. Benny D115]
MLVELLKNAFHATLRNTKEFDPLPPVQITVSQGNGHVAIRIRDRGGGIPQSIHARVFDYSFTTVKPQSDGGMEDEAVGDAACANPIAQSSPVSGLGFGLPMAKIYAEYFNGSVNLISMEGYGCDAFLELPSIEPDGAPGIQI